MKLLLPLLVVFALSLLGIPGAFAQTPTPEPDGWCFAFDFEQDQYDWTVTPPDPGLSGNLGSYQSGSGFVSGNIYGNGSSTNAGIQLSETMSLTSISITYDRTSTCTYTNFSPAFVSVMFILNGSTIIFSEGICGTVGTGIVKTATGSWSATQLNLLVRMGYTNNNSQTTYGSARISEVMLTGTGTSPFGDNCSPPVASFSYNQVEEFAPSPVNFTSTSTGEISSYAWSFTQGAMNCTTGTIESTIANPSWTFEFPGDYDVCLKVCNEYGCDVAVETITVLNGAPAASILTNPLGPEDRNTDLVGLNNGLFYLEEFFDEEPTRNTGQDPSYQPKAVYGVSNKDNAYVMAVASGEVISVEPFVCPSGFTLENIDDFLFFCPSIGIPSEVHQSSNFARYRIQDTAAYTVRVRYLPEASNVYIFIEYVVVAPRVEVGDIITEGCIIGQTLKLFNLVGEGISGGVGGPIGPVFGSITINPPQADGFGITAIAAWEFEPGLPVTYFQSREAIDLYESLVIDRLPSTDCDTAPVFSSCQGDGDLSRQTDWASQGSVLWNTGPGVVLYPGGVISRTAYIDDTVENGLDVNARRQQSADGRLTITLGSTTQIFDVVTTSGVYSIAQGDHGSSPVQVRIENSGNVPVEITRACVSPNSGDGDGIPVGGTCQIRNPYFALGLDGWTTSGVNLLPDLYTGSVSAAHNATLEQNVTLMEGDHMLEVIVGAPSAWLLSSGTVTVEYEIADTWFELGEAPAGDFFLSPDYRYRFSGSFSLEGNYQGPFAIRITLDGLTGSVYLYQICIKPDVLPTDGTAGPLPQFNMRCDQRVPPPEAANNAISSWTWFLWNSLDQFFQCDLMLILNKMLLSVNDGMSLMRWQAAYWQAFAFNGIKWTSESLIPWLGGHLNNIAQGKSTFTIESAPQCDNIICLLGAFLDLAESFLTDTVGRIITGIETIVGFVFQIISQLLGIAETFITLVFSLFEQIVSAFLNTFEYLNAIVVGLQVSEPTPLPGIPNCASDPRSTPACSVFWLADNTIFSGRGSLVVPLVIALMSIHVLITAYEMFRNAIFKARQGL